MIRHAGLALAMAWLCPGAQAAAPELPDWLRLDGFGTLGAYRADDPVASVRSDARAASASLQQWRLDGDSQAAAQLTLNPNGSMRGVLQLLAKDDVQGRFRPRVEWLYAAWDLAPNWQLKAGRTSVPLFLSSDTRNVLYAQTTVRPVNTVYQLNPLTHSDGLNLLWNTHNAFGDWGVEAALGQASAGVAAGSIEADRVAALAARWHRQDWTLRLAHGDFHMDARLPLTDALLTKLRSGQTQCGNCQEVLATRGRSQGVRVLSDAAALLYDNGHWAVQAEAVQRRSNSALVPDARAWYAQASLRLGAFTPYLVLGQQRFTEPPLGLSTLPQAGAELASVNAAIDFYLQSPNDRKIWQLGLRWDLQENLALKLQLESLHHTRNTRTGLSNLVSFPFAPPLGSYAGPAWDGKVQVLTLNLDFVF